MNPDDDEGVAMLRILGRPTSINVRKVLWLADEVGVPYEHESPALDTPAFRVLNPNAQVPVIIDGELVLWESNTICRYLAGRHGRADLLPVDPRERARVEQWMDWQATDLNTAWRAPFMGLVRRNPQFADPAAIAAGTASWNALMARLDAHLAAGGPYVAGERFTLADIVLGLSTVRWRMTPIERPALSGVDAWFARLRERPAFLAHGDNGVA